MQRAYGWSERGGAGVVAPQTSGGVPLLRDFQQSYPFATITVYITGSGGVLGTLFSDNGVTPLANPFSADQFGFWAFYASNGTYDIQISGGGLGAPFTLGAVTMLDPLEITTQISAPGEGFYPNSIAVQLSNKLGPLLADIRDFGCVADTTSVAPGTDNTANFQKALNAIATQTGGGALWIPPSGQFFGLGAVDVPSNVQILGHGYKSGLMRLGTLASGRGLLNYTAVSNCMVRDVLIDGNVLTPTGLLYSSFGGDPMSTLLTANTSIWVHPGCSGLSFQSGFIEHTGGYAILLDAEDANINDIDVFDWWFRNNRPNLFGTSGGDLNYGSWTGGLLWRGNCSTKLFSVRGLSVRGCHWRRCTGNTLWGHSQGFNTRHENVNLLGNDFQDIGLDGILMGNVYGGAAKGNLMHRVGYITLTDTDTPNPRYLTGLNATGVDGGYSDGVQYEDNIVCSVNGDAYDLDGHSHTTMSGNFGMVPLAGTPQYNEDSVALYGPNQNGVNTGQGIVGGNSQLNGGSQYISVNDNTLINFGVSAIVVGSGKFWQVKDNTIFHPLTAISQPIQLYSVPAVGDEGLCHGNVVEGNLINYPGTFPYIAETGSGWVVGSVNRVFDNQKLGGGIGVEFSPNTSSGSYSGFSVGASSWVDRNGSVVSIVGLSSGQIALNVTSGYIQTELIAATGSSTAAVNVPAGGVSAKYLIGTTSFTLIADSAAHAGLSDPGQGRIYFDSSLLEFLVSEDGGAYVPLVGGGGGGGTPGAPTFSVQFNAGSGNFGGNAHFTWDNTNEILTVGHTGSVGGINSISTSTSALQAATGGVTALYLITTDSVFWTQEAAPALSAVGQTRVYMDSSSHQLMASQNGAAYVPVIASGSVAGSNKQVQYNNSGAFGASSDLTFDNATHILEMHNSGGGIASDSTSTAALNAPVGGVNAKWLIANDSLFLVEEAAPALSAAGQTRFYMDSTTHAVLVSQNGAAYTPLVAVGSVAGANTQVQYNNSGAFGASANFTWVSGTQILSTGSFKATDSVYFVEEAAPAVSAGGQTRFYMDSTSHIMMVSMNGASYVPLVAAGSVAGSNTQIQYNNSGAFGASSDLTWNNSTHILEMHNAAGGIASDSTSLAALNAQVGGLQAKYVIALTSVSVEGDTSGHAGLSNPGEGRIYFDSGTNIFMASQNGGAYVPLVSTGSVAGSNTQIQYNNSGAFGASADLTWDNAAHVLEMHNSGGGIASDSTSTAALNASAGGVTAKWHIATDSVFWVSEAAPAVSAASQARVYMDSGSNLLNLSLNGGAYFPILTSATAVTSLTAGSGISLSASVGSVTITNSGVRSLNGLTGTPSVVASTGINVSAGGSSVTITNTGVTSLGGSTGALSLVGGTGVTISTLTISIGQAVGTGNSVTFANVTTAGVFQALPSTAGQTTFQVFRSAVNWTLIDGQGNISTVATVACQTVNLDYQSTGGVLQMRGTTIINNSATFVGAGCDCKGSAIGGAGFNYWNGASYNAGITATITNAFTNITVKGGVITAFV